MEEVKNKDVKEINFAKDFSIAKLFLETVTDNVARSILFGTPVNAKEPSPKTLELDGYGIIRVMKCIIKTAFTVAISRWKQLCNEDEWVDDDYFEYFKNSRFSKIFQSAIGNEEINIDLQVFALIELWVSMNNSPRDVSLRLEGIFVSGNMEGGDSIGLTLQAARDAIKKVSFKGIGDEGLYTKEYLNRLCYRLLNSFLIFRIAKFTYPEDNRLDDDEDFSIKYDLPEEKVTLYPNKCFKVAKLILSYQQLQLLHGNKDVYEMGKLSLYHISEITVFDGTTLIVYHSFDGESEAKVDQKVFNVKIEKSAVADAGDIKEMRKFLSFSYKNIRELATAISDAIKDATETRRELLDRYNEKIDKKSRKDSSNEQIISSDASNIYWDNLITLMLVEMGFSDFLEIALKEEKIFYAVLKNIGLRCIGRSEAGEYIKDYKKRRAELIRECGENQDSLDAEQLELRVRTVLRAMKSEHDENRKLNPFEESLTFKYENIVRCLDILGKRDTESADKVEESRLTLVDIFRNIFVFLQIFYCGLDMYAREKGKEKYLPKLDETEEAANKRVAIRFDECKKEFKRAAQEKYNEIKNACLTEVFEGFCKMCSDYNSYSSDNYNISEKAKWLKFIITRNYICDVTQLRRFTSIVLDNGEKSNIFEMIENPDPKYYANKEKYAEWLTYFHDVFFFFIYNEDYNERGLWDNKRLRAGSGEWKLQDKDCDPIYPYIVTYYKENIDRDNLKKCTYRVPIPDGGGKENRKQLVVTLLTEENYPPRTYFCIPLRYGSSDNWWINPFLIPKDVIRDLKTEDKDEPYNN